MISLLVGDDLHAIHKKLSTYKRRLAPAWMSFNYHRFPASAVVEAVHCALTPAVGKQNAKLIVVEECNFKLFTEEVMPVLQLLPQIPTSTHLVWIAAGIDKRLKVSKFLLSQGNLLEFPLIPPWRADLITKSIAAQARVMGLSLNRKVVEYLAAAIGNDAARAESELQKLATYSNGITLHLNQVRSLVPSTTQNSLQLAEAIRAHRFLQIADLLQYLLERDTFPLAICATLLTQFRTWMAVKAALVGGVKTDVEIAKICQIANPKRVYFLKQEVAAIPLKSWIQSVSILLDFEESIKRGLRKDFMLPILWQVAQLFPPN